MITAYARAYQVLNEEKYLHAAEKSARFMRTALYDTKNKRLYRRWRDGERSVTGTSDDYAFLIQGLIDLYESSFDIEWLRWAIELTEKHNELFFDSAKGGFFMTARDHDKNLLLRIKVDSDNVEPASSSVAVLNLLRLAQFTGRDDFHEKAEKTLSLFGAQMKQQPRSLPQMLVAVDYSLSKPKQIIILGGIEGADTRKMLREVHKQFIPNKILMVLGSKESQQQMSTYMPSVSAYSRINGKATAYVCINYACLLPTNDVQVMSRALEGISDK